MANNLLYQKSWERQTIDGDFADTVRVRIFSSPIDVISDNYEKVVATDGRTFQKSRHTSRKHTKNHSYVVLSNGIHERFPGNSCHLYIKLYLTDNFDISSLKDVDFLEKNYVIEAIEKYLNGELEEKKNLASEVLPPMLHYLRKKIGSDYEDFYCRLKNSAYLNDIDSVEKRFKDFNISTKYQALFWKEMYQDNKKEKELILKNCKFRWKDLLDTHSPFASVNVKIYLKKNAFFIHEENLAKTDGYVLHGIVHDYTYAIVAKTIERKVMQGTFHLDIKVYLNRYFNAKHLLEISEFWGDYVRKAIKSYLPSSKILP